MLKSRAGWMKQGGFAAGFFAVLTAVAAAAVPVVDVLPPSLQDAAKRWRVDPSAVTIAVIPLRNVDMMPGVGIGDAKPLLTINADRPVSPASTVKLVTTLAGLELLGTNFRWTTGFYGDSRPDKDGRIQTLYIRGGGDATFVVEELQMALDRLSQLGIRHILGNIVIDRSAFNLPKGDPGAFDGRASRPYNVLPDAALLNYRNLSFEFVPETGKNYARVVTVPKLAGVTVPATIKLKKGRCGDWKTAIGYEIAAKSDGTKRVRFRGALPSACGPKNFNVISFDENEYAERLIRNLWVRDGRTWQGKVVSGPVSTTAERLAVHFSEPLADNTVLVNKWSNNLIARHVFLSLGTVRVKAEEEAKRLREIETVPANEKTPSAFSENGRQPLVFSRGVTPDDARNVLSSWLAENGIDDKAIWIDNGSGLSRTTRTTARVMAEVLALGWKSSVMPEYMASLPVTGVDGTMAKRKVAVKYGHIKTGYLSDVRSIGGYIHAENGERYALFASVHGEKNMPGGIAFLNQVIEWLYRYPAEKPRTERP